jgi:RNA polymerase sigma factor
MTDAERAKLDPAYREEFLAGKEDFILRCAGKVCRRMVTKQDDAWSVALSACNEAIDAYDPEKGSFEGLARRVIERRLTDAMRRECRTAGEVPVEPYVFDGNLDEDPTAMQLETAQKAGQLTAQEALSPERSAREEIDSMQTVLAGYGFSFFDLASCSPKAGKTRRGCALAVRALLRDDTLLASMRRTGTLPAQGILRREKVPPKILERHRRYIIAAAEILDGDYPILSSYLYEMRKEMRR